MNDGYDDPEVKLAYALSQGEIEPFLDEPPLDWMVEMHQRFEAATTFDARLEVLHDYMSERSALNAIGIMLGERESDVVWLPAEDEARADTAH